MHKTVSIAISLALHFIVGWRNCTLMRISILADGLPVGTFDATDLWRDLLVFAAERWESEAAASTISALQIVLAA